MGYFIDWLSCYQDFPEGTIPDSSRFQDIRIDLETGDIVRDKRIGHDYEGSYSTKLYVHVIGDRIIVSGNPSRFNRLENLYGVDSIFSAVAVYNRFLSKLGLPNFRNYSDLDSPSSTLIQTSDNPIRKSYLTITRVDVTLNLSTTNADGALRHLSGYVHHGTPGYLYPDGNTVEWFGNKIGNKKGSRRVHVKYYKKSADIDLTIKKIRRLESKAFLDNEDQKVSEYGQALTYLNRLKYYLDQEEAIRFEVSFKAQKLADLGLKYLFQWRDKPDVLSEIASKYLFHTKLKTWDVDMNNILNQLIENGYTPKEAQKADNIYQAWLNGKDMHFTKGSLTQPTYYRYRRMLLSVGVDISLNCDITRLPIRSMKHRYSELEKPDFYGFTPNKPTLYLV